jgi:hypothetical protein
MRSYRGYKKTSSNKQQFKPEQNLRIRLTNNKQQATRINEKLNQNKTSSSTEYKPKQHPQRWKQSNGLHFHSYNMHGLLAFRFKNHLQDNNCT